MRGRRPGPGLRAPPPAARGVNCVLPSFSPPRSKANRPRIVSRHSAWPPEPPPGPVHAGFVESGARLLGGPPPRYRSRATGPRRRRPASRRSRPTRSPRPPYPRVQRAPTLRSPAHRPPGSVPASPPPPRADATPALAQNGAREGRRPQRAPLPGDLHDHLVAVAPRRRPPRSRRARRPETRAEAGRAAWSPGDPAGPSRGWHRPSPRRRPSASAPNECREPPS